MGLTLKGILHIPWLHSTSILHPLELLSGLRSGQGVLYPPGFLILWLLVGPVGGSSSSRSEERSQRMCSLSSLLAGFGTATVLLYLRQWLLSGCYPPMAFSCNNSLFPQALPSKVFQNLPVVARSWLLCSPLSFPHLLNYPFI